MRAPTWRPGAVAAAALAGLALSVAPGCGADEGRDAEDLGSTGSARTSTAPKDSTGAAPTRAETAPAEPQTAPQGRAPEAPGSLPSDDGGGTRGRSEGGAGGVGDELPAHSEALFTGRGGRVLPPVVRVPPFIAIRARLRSADGAGYLLRARSRTLRASGRASAAATFDGLRPGRRIVLEGPNGRVVIEASAEPGP